MFQTFQQKCFYLQNQRAYSVFCRRSTLLCLSRSNPGRGILTPATDFFWAEEPAPHTFFALGMDKVFPIVLTTGNAVFILTEVQHELQQEKTIG